MSTIIKATALIVPAMALFATSPAFARHHHHHMMHHHHHMMHHGDKGAMGAMGDHKGAMSGDSGAMGAMGDHKDAMGK